MGVIALMLLAAPAGAKPPESLLPGAEGFDLARMRDAEAGCDDRTPGAIVVCGRRKNDEIRVRDPGAFERGPVKAEVKLPSGATVDVHAEQHSLPDGRSAPAAMVSVKIPF